MNLVEWLTANLGAVLSVLAVVVALVYLWLKDRSGKLALELIAQVWALVVSLAGDVLAGIPEAEFDEWAWLIHGKLPAIAQVFISQPYIKTALMKLRDALVDELAPSKALWADEDYGKVTAKVKQYLA